MSCGQAQGATHFEQYQRFPWQRTINLNLVNSTIVLEEGRKRSGQLGEGGGARPYENNSMLVVS